MLGVVVSVLAVVCKQMRQLLTMLGHAVHRWKDTTHNALETRCNAHAWPQLVLKEQCKRQHCSAKLRRSGKTGNKRNLGIFLAQKFDRVETLRNNSQQHATTSNNMQQGVHTDMCLRFRFFYCWLTWTRDNETRTCVLSLCAEDSVRVLIVDFSIGRKM